MERFWIAVATVAVVSAVALPLIAAVLVSLASMREEYARSLGGEAPGLMARMARLVLAFRAERDLSPRGGADPDWPQRRRARHSRRAAEREVRFAHARRTLPDTRKQPANGQPQPDPRSADRRQPAGV